MTPEDLVNVIALFSRLQGAMTVLEKENADLRARNTELEKAVAEMRGEEG